MAGIAMLLLCSCDAENSISTKYPCQFYFKSQYHPGTSLETALNGTGVYTMVSAKKVNGAWNIYSTLNDGKNQTETIILTTAKENYTNYTYLGAGNDPKDAKKNGFIMGLTNLSGPVAWDRQCPNCLEQYGGTNYPLEWTGNRQSVICDKCKRNHHKRRKEQKRQGADEISSNLQRQRNRYIRGKLSRNGGQTKKMALSCLKKCKSFGDLKK
jgi:hypothetical protein